MSEAEWKTADGANVLVMFRRPADRLRSAYNRKNLPWGCRGQPQSCARNYEEEQRGCQLRMLNGLGKRSQWRPARLPVRTRKDDTSSNGRLSALSR